MSPLYSTLHRLKEHAKYCEFEKLGTWKMTVEEKLILLRIIEDQNNK